MYFVSYLSFPILSCKWPLCMSFPSVVSELEFLFTSFLILFPTLSLPPLPLFFSPHPKTLSPSQITHSAADMKLSDSLNAMLWLFKRLQDWPWPKWLPQCHACFCFSGNFKAIGRLNAILFRLLTFDCFGCYFQKSKNCQLPSVIVAHVIPVVQYFTVIGSFLTQ